MIYVLMRNMEQDIELKRLSKKEKKNREKKDHLNYVLVKGLN